MGGAAGAHERGLPARIVQHDVWNRLKRRFSRGNCNLCGSCDSTARLCICRSNLGLPAVVVSWSFRRIRCRNAVTVDEATTLSFSITVLLLRRHRIGPDRRRVSRPPAGTGARRTRGRVSSGVRDGGDVGMARRRGTCRDLAAVADSWSLWIPCTRWQAPDLSRSRSPPRQPPAGRNGGGSYPRGRLLGARGTGKSEPHCRILRTRGRVTAGVDCAHEVAAESLPRLLRA